MADIDTYRKMLAVNKHRLDDELEIQPDVMMRIASEVTTRNGRQLEAKDDLARIEAELAEELREDEPKLTVAGIDGKVRRHRSRLDAWRKYQAARTDYEDWAAMLEAWRQRGYTLKTLADLYSAQYFSTDSVVVNERRRRREEQQDEARAEMRRASHTTLAREDPPAEEPPRRRRAAE